MSAAKLDFRVGADKSALTHRETAKEARSTSICSFSPWGEGGRRSDEGSNVKVDLSNPLLEFVSSLHSLTNSCPPPRRGMRGGFCWTLAGV